MFLLSPLLIDLWRLDKSLSILIKTQRDGSPEPFQVCPQDAWHDPLPPHPRPRPGHVGIAFPVFLLLQKFTDCLMPALESLWQAKSRLLVRGMMGAVQHTERSCMSWCFVSTEDLAFLLSNQKAQTQLNVHYNIPHVYTHVYHPNIHRLEE